MYIFSLKIYPAHALAAAPRIDALAISHSEQGVTLGCTQDKLCIEITSPQTTCKEKNCVADLAWGIDVRLILSNNHREETRASFRLTGPSSTGEYSSSRLWPKIVRYEGGILAVVETQERAMYSGGGATSTTLRLTAFLPDQLPFEALSIPQHASVMIRACFNELDMRRREGAPVTTNTTSTPPSPWLENLIQECRFFAIAARRHRFQGQSRDLESHWRALISQTRHRYRERPAM